MSIFGSIVSAIVSHIAPKAAAAAPVEIVPTPAEAAPEATIPVAVTTPLPVDVDAVLSGMAAHAGQTLNWKESIVDLLKLLGLDSSLDARKKLAAELHYTGDTNDSAAMNIWLIKEVRQKLAENGGKLPADF